MEYAYTELTKDSGDQQEAYRGSLKEVEKKLDAIEEKYYVSGEMGKETFEKFYFRLKGEYATIAKELERSGTGISNPSEAIAKALRLSLNLAPTWASSDVAAKEKLQKLVFPEGIIYDRKTEAFRTLRVNSVFAYIASGTRVIALNENGQSRKKKALSISVGATGFEPVTFAV